MSFFRQFLCVFEAAFASKPAPTGERIPKCGSGLAREGAIPHTEDFTTDGLLRIEHNP
jgi:hypothetical protein